MVAERLRLTLNYQPSLFLWRIDPDQLGWLPAMLGILGVALHGSVARVYWAVFVAAVIVFWMRRAWLQQALSAKAAGIARRELVPVAELLLASHPDVVAAIDQRSLSEPERMAMLSWVQNQARRLRLGR